MNQKRMQHAAYAPIRLESRESSPGRIQAAMEIYVRLRNREAAPKSLRKTGEYKFYAAWN